MTSTPTRPVDNVVITMKGLQGRNIHIIDGTTVENKGKLILSPITVYQQIYIVNTTCIVLIQWPYSTLKTRIYRLTTDLTSTNH